MPTDALRDWYICDGLDALAIAERVGLPAGLVIQQVARALLTPEIAGRAGKNPPGGALAERPLDSTQAAASQVIRGPLLLKAGPGTGKTRTLVGRIAVLLERDVAPSAILALTFSNRAAEEMRARVALAYPEEARNIWMGTFHAFGLELLRKYGSRIGLPPRPEVLDPVDAVSLLEGALRELELDHYQNLYEPTVHLRDILAAISRAKDELVEPTHYFQLAEAMRKAASGEHEIDVAEKTLEVARVYAYYQARLDEAHQLDFGDLIRKAVALLRMHDELRAELRRTYQHILVDEYQDVNRASGLLLREIAGAGEGLWVVGDERQAIYRFRGASPANMRFFEQDFPGGRVLSLGRNYRSQPPIVDVFSAVAPKMCVTDGQPFTDWVPERPLADGEVRLEIAEDLSSEAEGIAREIERHRVAGIAYRDQAVLCRSHTSLGRIGAALERRRPSALPGRHLRATRSTRHAGAIGAGF